MLDEDVQELLFNVDSRLVEVDEDDVGGKPWGHQVTWCARVQVETKLRFTLNFVVADLYQHRIHNVKWNRVYLSHYVYKTVFLV